MQSHRSGVQLFKYMGIILFQGTQPLTPPMDILNTRFVTQPKTLSDKKSHFLKTLRQEDEKVSEPLYFVL